MMGVDYRNRRGEETFTSSIGIPKNNDILTNLITYKRSMGRRLAEVLILYMVQLGRWVFSIISLAGLGSIFSYISDWNADLSSRLENCLARLFWKAHTILTNKLNTSYLSSDLTPSPAHRGSILEMASSYSCLGADQTVAIWIKSKECLILSPH